MTFALLVGIVVLGVGIGWWWLSFRYQFRPPGVPRWPAPAPEQQRGHDFEEELRPYRTGEYPVVEAAEPVEVDPVEAPEPAVERTGTVGYVSQHAAADDEDLTEPTVRPWQVPALENEATPFFWSTGNYPVCDVDLSATNSWNRADLLRRLGMDEEAAA